MFWTGLITSLEASQCLFVYRKTFLTKLKTTPGLFWSKDNHTIRISQNQISCRMVKGSDCNRDEVSTGTLSAAARVKVLEPSEDEPRANRYTVSVHHQSRESKDSHREIERYAR
ncbi:hypothetical protein H2203_007196 [Taxawa tesnikishii (nom. ined.)]|nr:hypothetical protein H2203_007196 [Dothideales sp. JES 119]